MFPDTIVALSTPWGVSAIAKIRVSGPLVRSIIEGALNRRQLTSHHAFLANYCCQSGAIIDEVIAIFFEEKKAYTGEDSLEIDCHGSPLIIREIIDDIISRGARSAEPGEYTQRAFLNKKLDLCQAEAVLDVIHAKNEEALHIAQKQLRGKLSEKIFQLSDHLLNILANIEAHIDFSDEDLELDSHIELSLKVVQKEIADILLSHQYRKALQDGIAVAIVGAPNVGKSSLLNALLQEERALVTDIPGTTRDFITENIQIGPYGLKIIDTAGLRDTSDVVEAMGIQKTIENIRLADLCLVVKDLSSPVKLNEDVIFELQKKKCITVYNKTDLFHDDKPQNVRESSVDVVYISAKNGDGIENLLKSIKAVISREQLFPSNEEIVINSRHKEIFESVKASIDRAIDILTSQYSYELCASDVRDSLESLGYITGKYNTEDMLGRVFSQFCVGK